MHTRTRIMLLGSTLAIIAGCTCGAVSNEDEARQAYLGLDQSVSRALTLGLQGFNQAQSANISAQTGQGDKSGTMTVGGQVDQGASNNKGLRLTVALTNYADLTPDGGVDIVYATDAGAPAALEVQLKGLPNATLTGTMKGTYLMSGKLMGPVTLDLSLSGTTREISGQPGSIERVPNATTITGTATSAGGTYQVNVTR